MNDEEKSPPQSDIPNGFRFVLAACFAQFLAPAAGMFLFDFSHSPSISIVTDYVFGIGRILLGSWQLAAEPLTVAVLLTLFLFMNRNRRKAVAIIVAITMLNIFVSGVFIVGRSM